MGQNGLYYNTNTWSIFLNTPPSFLKIQINFQTLNVSIDQKTWPSICFKTHGQAFQTLSWVFQILNRDFEASKKKIERLAQSLKNLAECLKSLDTYLRYSEAHAVESTMVVFPIYPEVHFQWNRRQTRQIQNPQLCTLK